MGGEAAKSRWTARRGLLTLLIATPLALALGPVAGASASLTLTSSPGGTTTGYSTPTFAGTTEDLLDPVSVQIYKGPSAEGKPVRTLTTSAPLESTEWSLTVGEALGDDEYTALAEQTELGGVGPRSTAGPVTFVIDTKRPTVVLEPLALSSNTKPSFSGTASETAPVTVHIHSGPTAGGPELTSVTAPVSGGTWSTKPLSSTLVEGQYTAVATEPSAIPGVQQGESEAVTFEVHTKPPSVSLEPLPARSNVTNPTLHGSASDSKAVTVHIWEGKTEVAKATSPVSGGTWSASVALAGGKHSYAAYATEPSSISGVEEGTSPTIGFEVDTEPPGVSLAPVSPNPSSNRTPSFSGTASEPGPVTVHIFEGGTEYTSVTTTASGGTWSTGALPKALPEGEHTFTAVATEPSSIHGNGEGESHMVSFTVDTEPPKLSLAPVPTPSRNTKPTFGGTDGGAASQTRPIVVHVFEGPKPEGNEVAKVTASGAQGAWSSGSVKLSEGEHTYTAVATQESPLGNEAATSQPQTFVVDTEPPKLTLDPVNTPSNNSSPSFGGSDGGAGSETKPIVVRVFEGTRPEGKEVAKATTPGTQGPWTSGPVKLPKGGEHTYTAIATQQSPLGNEAARSSAQTFVVDNEPPHLTLNAVPTPTNNIAPEFAGTDGGAGSETKPIVVHVYEGPQPEGREVGKVTTSGAQGAWASAAVQLEKGTHTYTAVATQESPVGNAEGRSSPVVFSVNTEPPVVTLKPVAEVSNNTQPSFSGTASETTQVTVNVYSGPSGTGTPVRTLKAPVSNGRWFSSPVIPALKEGEYSAVATEPSALGNGPGASAPIVFVVNLRAPTVVVTQPQGRFKDTAPTVSGTASEPGTVTVEVFEGANTAGRLVQTATANAASHTWSAGPVGLAPRGRHTYTVVALEKIGNETGKSAPVTFEVDTEPPAVTLSPPLSLSNHSTPSFSGSSDEPSPVTVEIYAGTKAEGSPVSAALASVTGTGGASGGTWTSENAAPALGDGTYTAVALQKSAIGNEEGKSAAVTFTVDTAPPVVTLKPLPSPSSIRTPSFSGTASDHEAVTVTIYPGPTAQGTPAATVTAEGGGAEWVSAKINALAWGQYTAIATQPSSLGNPLGWSEPVTFTVAQIPPIVAGEAPSSIKRSSAVFYASVDPNGGAVSQGECQFEYGTSTAYGQSVGCASVSGAFPITGAAAQVFARANELSPSTTYHFRIVAGDEGGSAYGADQSFTTAAAVTFNEGGAPEEGPVAGASTHAHAGVASFFASQLTPPRRGTLAWLLKWGVFGMRLRSPGPGTAVIGWYYLPPGASLTKKTKHHPLLVAAGRRTFGAAQTLVVKIHLTAEGRRLLRRSKHIRLTAMCTFTPPGHASTKALASFELRR